VHTEGSKGAAATKATAPPARLPDAPGSNKQDRARLQALNQNPALADLMERGFDARVLSVRDGQAGFQVDERSQVFGQVMALSGAQRKALRDVLLFKPPHPQLAKMDRRDPAIKGPPSAMALMRILSGELLGQKPASSDFHQERVDQVVRAFPQGANTTAYRDLMLSHESVLRLAERTGPAAFTLVDTFGADGVDALLSDGFYASELVDVALRAPERIQQARAFMDTEGPKALGEALDQLYDLKHGANVSPSEAIVRLGFAPAAKMAKILSANKHGASAYLALDPQDSLLDLAERGPKTLTTAIEEAADKVVEFGSGRVPLLRNTTAWPPLDVPRTAKVAEAESRLLQALGLDLKVLEDPSQASPQEVSRLIRGMRKQIHARDPEASKMLSKELAGRRFVSRKYYDALYAAGTGNPEHRYSKATFNSWREGEAFVRASAKVDRGQPLTANRVLEVISGIHQRAGQGMVQIHESHLKAEDLGRMRSNDDQHVQLGSHFQQVDSERDARLASNPYLQPTESFPTSDSDKVNRHVMFSKGSDVPRLMQETATWIAENEGKMAPEDLAAEAHFRLVSIHPFMDGNGRSCKLMVDYLLRRADVEPPVWRQGDILVKQDSWSGAIKEGVAFHLKTVQRYFRDGIVSSSQAAS